MVFFGMRGPVAAAIWIVLVVGIALASMRNRRVWFPERAWQVFRGLTLVLFGLSLLVAVPTQALFAPVVLGVRWMWFPLLFPAGVLAVFAFGPIPALLLTLGVSFMAVVIRHQPYPFPATATTRPTRHL